MSRINTYATRSRTAHQGQHGRVEFFRLARWDMVWPMDRATDKLVIAPGHGFALGHQSDGHDERRVNLGDKEAELYS